jgi:Arc/MetJ-type ribon-helix-helix transcriptional regulator
MNIRLKPDTEEWLKAQVAEGRFESVEEAVEVLVADDRVQAKLNEEDLSWAKPYIEEGLAAIEAGDLIPAEEVHAEIRARLAQRKRS